MTDKTKKVIAREGLIVIGFIVCAVIVDIVIRTTTMTSVMFVNSAHFDSLASNLAPYFFTGKSMERVEGIEPS